MKCPKCGGFLYRVYSPTKSKYMELPKFMYCRKCQKMYEATLSGV